MASWSHQPAALSGLERHSIDDQDNDDAFRPLKKPSDPNPDHQRYDPVQFVPETQSPGPWGVRWRSPAVMVFFFISATVFAVGHDCYYASLHGTVVVNTTSKWDMDAVRDGQEWKIRFGTGFAFLVKAMFAQAVAIAFQQHLWLTTRNKAVTIGGLDAMFAAAGNLLSFFNGEFLKKAKLGAVLALLVWLIPLSALVTSATLTVTPSINSSTKIQLVPSINFSQIDPFYDSHVVEVNGKSSNQGITPYLGRLVTSAASSLQLLPMSRAIPSSNYNLTFHGPSFRCHEPSALIKDAIIRTLNATWYISSAPQVDLDFTSKTSWLAFPPSIEMLILISQAEQNPLSDIWLRFLGFAASCLITPTWNVNLPDISKRISICGAISTPKDGTATLETVTTQIDANYGRIWIWAQDLTYECVLTDTEYNVHFFYSALEGAQRIKPEYDFRWTENDIHGSYFAIGSAFSNLLTGVLRGFRSGVLSYKTRMAETGIFSALKVTESPAPKFSSGISPLLLTPDVIGLARNKSVGELVEELSRNVTLSLFSADKVLILNETQAEVTTSFNVNVYSYNRRNLVITYAVTFVASLIGVLIGCVAFVKNGVSYDNSFSAFMLTTRNESLDDLVAGHSMGTKPLAENVQKAELKFGLLLDSEREGPGGVRLRRAGFGFKNEVVPLQKKAPYY